MAQNKVGSWFSNRVAQNLKHPNNDIFGWYVKKTILKNNKYLAQNAVKLCNIHPNYKVLELGFGTGVGLDAAYQIVKKGSGKVYGIDSSFYMVDTASKRLRKGVKDRKVMLFHGTVAHIPLNTDSMHRVFHCNAYYFWPNMRLVLREIYRVLKPGGVMITTLNMDSLKASQSKGYLKHARADPVRYMMCLENYGFEAVHMEYMNDEITGRPFQVIFSEISEKPAHHQDMLSDNEDSDDDETFEADLISGKLGNDKKLPV